MNSPSCISIKIEREVRDGELLEILNSAFRPEKEILDALFLISHKQDKILMNQVTEHELAELTQRAIRVASHMTMIADRLENLTH